MFRNALPRDLLWTPPRGASPLQQVWNSHHGGLAFPEAPGPAAEICGMTSQQQEGEAGFWGLLFSQSHALCGSSRCPDQTGLCLHPSPTHILPFSKIRGCDGEEDPGGPQRLSLAPQERDTCSPGVQADTGQPPEALLDLTLSPLGLSPNNHLPTSNHCQALTSPAPSCSQEQLQKQRKPVPPRLPSHTFPPAPHLGVHTVDTRTDHTYIA